MSLSCYMQMVHMLKVRAIKLFSMIGIHIIYLSISLSFFWIFSEIILYDCQSRGKKAEQTQKKEIENEKKKRKEKVCTNTYQQVQEQQQIFTAAKTSQNVASNETTIWLKCSKEMPLANVHLYMPSTSWHLLDHPMSMDSKPDREVQRERGRK